MSVTTKVELIGPFFTHNPGKTLYANIRDMQDALAGEMEGIVRQDIAAHAGSMPAYTGWTTMHVLGYTTGRRSGKRWALWSAVGIPTEGMSRAQAIRTKAAAAGIERRFHPFRNVKSAVYRARALISVDLAKGLN